MIIVRALRGIAALACAASVFGACGGSAFTTGPADAGGVDVTTGETGSGSSGSSGSSGGGGSDGSSGGNPVTWCSSQTATFCEDFDRSADVTPFLASWSSYVQSNGTFHFAHTGVPSPPNALSVVGANNADVIVIKTFPLATRPKSARLEFELDVSSAGSVGSLAAAGFAAITYGDSIDDGFAALAIGSGPQLQAAWIAPADAGLTGTNAFQTSNSTQPFPATNAWTSRYAIEIDYATDGTACAQVFEGPTKLLAQCMPLPPPLSNPKVLSVALGDYAAGLGNTGNVDLSFDNVTFDISN